jgi:hypothetical protein
MVAGGGETSAVRVLLSAVGENQALAGWYNSGEAGRWGEMKRSRLLANAMAAVFALVFVYATSTDGQESSGVSQQCLPYIGAAWEELPVEGRAALLREFLALPREHFLERSAVAYVESEGFIPTEIMGPVMLDPDKGEELVAFREGVTYALDLPHVNAPVFPGLYWTSGRGKAWTVLLPDGETETYWVDREL